MIATAASPRLAAGNLPPPLPPPRRTEVQAPYARIEDVAADTLDGLTPVVVVNRRVPTAIHQVDGAADRPFPTLYSDSRRDVPTLARRVVRNLNERLRGTHGEGADAGRTVYGAVRFVDTEDVREGANAVVDALRRQGSPGVRAYGSVSFVTDPASIASRTTYSHDDSGATGAWVRPAADLHRVVAERLQRSDGSDGAPAVGQLLQLPRAAARDALRGWLQSSALAESDGYIEAQVRRLAPEDVLAAVVDLRPTDDVERRPFIDPGAPADDAQLATLEGHLRRLGVPTHRINAAG